MRRLLYRIGMWFVRQSGDDGFRPWYELSQRAEAAERECLAADDERWNAVKALRTFREAVERADSMISADMPDKAQQTLRVALIASREVRRTVRSA